MKTYIVDIQFPPLLEKKVVGLVPRQHLQIKELMAKGIVSSFSLSRDKQKFWLTMEAQDLRTIKKILQNMPLYHYMSIVTKELGKYGISPLKLPPIMLN